MRNKMTKTIKLPCYNIEIVLDDETSYISSDLFEKELDYIKNIHLSTREIDLYNKEIRRHNNNVEGLQQLILAHAEAGVDIESPAYIEGIESVVQGLLEELPVPF